MIAMFLASKAIGAMARWSGRRLRLYRLTLRSVAVASAIGSAYLPTCIADEPDAFRTLGAPMQAYEPNLFGYTHSSGDVGFVDFTLSVKYPLLPRLSEQWWSRDNRLFIAFTGRFAFYYDTLPSSPALVKRLNPKLFFQHIFVEGATDSVPGNHSDWFSTRAQEPRTYATFAYAHESNGQSVDTATEYAQAVESASDPRFAIDTISRGWDYLEVNARHVVMERTDYRWSVNGSAKEFLNNGVFQGRPEEVRSWEPTTQGKPRKQVDGLMIRGKFENVRPGSAAFSGTEFSVAYTTGMQDAGRYSTVRLEAGLQAIEIPLVLWCSRGYMSDLARYYLNVRSCGVAIAIAGF